MGVPWNALSPLQDLKDQSLNRSWFLTSQSIPQRPSRYGNHCPNIPDSSGRQLANSSQWCPLFLYHRGKLLTNRWSRFKNQQKKLPEFWGSG